MFIVIFVRSGDHNEKKKIQKVNKFNKIWLSNNKFAMQMMSTYFCT